MLAPRHSAGDPVVDYISCSGTGLPRGTFPYPVYEGVHLPIWGLLEILRKTTLEDQVPALAWP